MLNDAINLVKIDVKNKKMLIESTPAKPQSQNKINKLLEKDLKSMVLGLDPNELISLFRNL